MATELVSIPIEWLLGALIIILSTLIGFSLKNMRCIVRIEGKVASMEKNLTAHLAVADEKGAKLDQLETDVAVHDQMLHENRKTLDIHSHQIDKLQDR